MGDISLKKYHPDDYTVFGNSICLLNARGVILCKNHRNAKEEAKVMSYRNNIVIFQHNRNSLKSAFNFLNLNNVKLASAFRNSNRWMFYNSNTQKKCVTSYFSYIPSKIAQNLRIFYIHDMTSYLFVVLFI